MMTDCTGIASCTLVCLLPKRGVEDSPFGLSVPSPYSLDIISSEQSAECYIGMRAVLYVCLLPNRWIAGSPVGLSLYHLRLLASV